MVHNEQERVGMCMVVGIPKEVKDQDRRVSVQPNGVVELVHGGHEIVVQSGAGSGAGFSDEEYEQAGARVVSSAKGVFEAAGVIVKVKEPIP
jgi:alanine dehydrogenase